MTRNWCSFICLFFIFFLLRTIFFEILHGLWQGPEAHRKEKFNERFFFFSIQKKIVFFKMHQRGIPSFSHVNATINSRLILIFTCLAYPEGLT